MAIAVRKTPSSKTLASKRASPARSARRRSAVAAEDAATSGLPESKVKVILRFHLRNLSTSGMPVDDDTVFAGALSDQAIADMSARSLFKALSRRDVVNNGGLDKPWPAKWLELSVGMLAPELAS